MFDLNNKRERLEFEFLMWLQCDAGIDTVEKYEALSEQEYLELRKQFLEWFSRAVVIKTN